MSHSSISSIPEISTIGLVLLAVTMTFLVCVLTFCYYIVIKPKVALRFSLKVQRIICWFPNKIQRIRSKVELA